MGLFLSLRGQIYDPHKSLDSFLSHRHFMFATVQVLLCTLRTKGFIGVIYIYIYIYMKHRILYSTPKNLLR